MKSNIHSIILRRLRNAPYIQFGTDALALTDAAIAQVPEIGVAAEAFRNHLEAITDVFAPNPASPLTTPLEEADEARDRAITGLGLLARGFMYSANPTEAEAGAVIDRAITTYGKRITVLAYAAESATITSLVEDFGQKPELAAAISTLNLGGWVTALATSNASFMTLYLQRTREYGDTNPDTVRGLRVGADAAWLALRNQINAYFTIHNGAAPWANLVSCLNALVDQYNTLIAGRGDGKEDK